MVWAALGTGLQRGQILQMPINWYECAWDQGLWKSIRPASQLLCVSVTPQNLICTSWSATDRKARNVCVCVRHRGKTTANQGPHRAPLARCFMETSCLSISSGNTEKSKTQHVKKDFVGTSRWPQRTAGGQGGGGMDAACTQHLTLIALIGPRCVPTKPVWRCCSIRRGTALMLWTLVGMLV